MHFSLLALLTVLATGAAGAPASPDAPDRRSIGSWINGEWGKFKNASEEAFQTIEDTPGLVSGIVSSCPPCLSSLKNTGGACSAAVAGMGKNYKDDYTCISTLLKTTITFPPECSNCTSLIKEIHV
ncbi:hypothetical protein C8R47DRAFT_311335 [Mycena vitilis]|nr:hypothetical protein C8R47DRAFT_311335 [Mycena vitilis]